jgi:hypothetical protein
MSEPDARTLRFRTRLEPRGPAAADEVDVEIAPDEAPRTVDETLRRLEAGQPPR